MLALADSKSEFTVKISVCLLELLSYINFEVAVTAVLCRYMRGGKRVGLAMCTWCFHIHNDQN